MRHELNASAALQRLMIDFEAKPLLDGATKRAIDLAVAATMLVVLSPLILLIALAIVVDSPGGVFYRCSRVGGHGRELRMLKFRKMRDGVSGPALTAAGDERFTRVGGFLARTKLDEIPQLWNVLTGEMSLVGPRPEDPGFVEGCRHDYETILTVKPGITGLCQLAFAKESEIIDPDDPAGDYVSRLLPQKVAIDLLYAQRRSMLMDLRILAWTGLAVILRRNVAVHRTTAWLSLRRRPNRFERLPHTAGVSLTEGIFSLPEQLVARLPVSDVRAVVLAGGKGTRLAPYTSVLPKPLMPIGDRAILEIVLKQLRAHGICDVTLCVGYLSHLIEAVLGDGSALDTSVTYVRESQALGTAAPLRLVEDLDATFIVMNGDVLATLDYRALLRHHSEQKNLLTIASQGRPLKIDYGVLHVGSNGKGTRVQQFVEKPEVAAIVSIGIYVMEPDVLNYIPASGHFDFPDLVQALLAADEPVGVYDHDGMWFDIGRHEDYQQAAAAWFASESADEAMSAQVAWTAG